MLKTPLSKLSTIPPPTTLWATRPNQQRSLFLKDTLSKDSLSDTLDKEKDKYKSMKNKLKTNYDQSEHIEDITEVTMDIIEEDPLKNNDDADALEEKINVKKQIELSSAILNTLKDLARGINDNNANTKKLLEDRNNWEKNNDKVKIVELNPTEEKKQTLTPSKLVDNSRT